MRALDGRLLVGIVLFSAATLPPMRQWLEAGMRTHMMLQFPMLVGAGMLIGSKVPNKVASNLMRWNVLGLCGLTTLGFVLALAMLPRVLDMALSDVRVEVLKVAVLVATGLMLPASWRSSGLVLQAFFLGSVLPMTVAVGALYMDAPVRLCNAYRLDEQQRLGADLIAVSAAIAAAWLAAALYRTMNSTSEE